MNASRRITCGSQLWVHTLFEHRIAFKFSPALKPALRRVSRRSGNPTNFQEPPDFSIGALGFSFLVNSKLTYRVQNSGTLANRVFMPVNVIYILTQMITPTEALTQPLTLVNANA